MQDELYFLSYSVWYIRLIFYKEQDAEMVHQKLDYIHYNPVEAGVVQNPKIIYTVAQRIIVECTS